MGWGRGAAGLRGVWWLDMVEISPSRALPIALDRSVEAHLFLGDETSIASGEALTRALPVEAVVLACFEVASMDHRWPDPACPPRKGSLGSSSRATRLGAPVLARGPEPLVHEFHDRLCDRRGVALRDGTRASRAWPWLSHRRCPYQAVLENQV